MNPTRKVLIVATPGNLQAGLQILLAKLPDLETLVVADTRSAMGAISGQKPALVIVDCDVAPGRCADLLQHLKGFSSGLRCLALVSRVDDLATVTKSGADIALMKGIPAKNLLATVEALLVSGETHTLHSSA